MVNAGTRHFLWVCPEEPLPTDASWKRATQNLVAELSNRGHGVDLCFPVARRRSSSDTAIQRAFGVRAVHSFEGPKFGKHVDFLLHELRLRRPVLVYEGLRAAWESRAQRAWGRPFSVCRMHGFHDAPGPALRWQGIVRGLVRLREDREIARFEREFLQEVDAVTCGSLEELRSLKAVAPYFNGTVLPFAQRIPGDSAPWPVGLTLNLLFVGDLDEPQVEEGLTWFLEEVWPELVARRPETRFTVAGTGDAEWLRARMPLPGLRLADTNEDVQSLYADCHLVVAPVFLGAGARGLAIEAGAHGRACLSSAFGIEGAEFKRGESYLHADGTDSWIEWLAHPRLVDECLRLGAAARAHVISRFCAGIAATEFLKLVEPSLNAPEISLR